MGDELAQLKKEKKKALANLEKARKARDSAARGKTAKCCSQPVLGPSSLLHGAFSWAPILALEPSHASRASPRAAAVGN
jgi:hypothetical protein